MYARALDGTSQVPDPSQWLDQHGDYLFRYALLQLRDSALAEDLVQETLLAALESRERFSGASSERTWLTGILKHKIVDCIRRRMREPAFAQGDEEALKVLAATDVLFDERGEWVNGPRAWGDPEAALDQRQFWQAFNQCLRNLPKSLAMIFSLREFSEMPTDDLCAELGISASNSWVMLYRARVALRECLERNWLGSEPQGGR